MSHRPPHPNDVRRCLACGHWERFGDPHVCARMTATLPDALVRAGRRFDNDLRRRAEDAAEQVHLTPPYVLEPIRAALGGVIHLDPCTTPENPVDAVEFITPPADGAAKAWHAETVFCNPPYGEVRRRWVRRCAEAAAAGSRVVLLIPAHTDTRIWHEAMETATQTLFIRSRVKFGVPRSNGRQVAASHPSALVGWNVDLTAAAELGHVMAGVR
jgi:hypothetical protein